MFNVSIVISIVTAVIAILYSLVLFRVILSKPEGNKKTIDSAREIQNSAKKILSQKHSSVSMVATIVFVVLLYGMGWQIAIGFLVGVILSILVGMFGVNLASRTNARTVEASRIDLKSVFNVSYKSGSAIGLFVYGVGLLTIAGLYAIFHDLTVLLGLVFGASIVSIFSRYGEVFFKEELSAENISKSVNVTSDLFENLLFVLVVAMILANLTLSSVPNAILFPIVLTSAIIIANIISTWFVRFLKNSRNVIRIIRRGARIAVVLSATAFYFIAYWMMKTNFIHNFSVYYRFLIFIFLILALLGEMIALLILEQSAKDAADIAKAADLPNSNINKLISISKTTGKIAKYFAIGTAFLLALVAFAAFGEKILQLNQSLSFDLRDYRIISGLFLGGIFAYCFYLISKKSATTTGDAIICAAVAILAPALIGFLLGASILSGFLLGAIVVGLFLAISTKDIVEANFSSVIKTAGIIGLLIAPLVIQYNLNYQTKIIVVGALIIIVAALIIFRPKRKMANG